MGRGWDGGGDWGWVEMGWGLGVGRGAGEEGGGGGGGGGACPTSKYRISSKITTKKKNIELLVILVIFMILMKNATSRGQAAQIIVFPMVFHWFREASFNENHKET